jgi:hypothetical protein
LSVKDLGFEEALRSVKDFADHGTIEIDELIQKIAEL